MRPEKEMDEEDGAAGFYVRLQDSSHRQTFLRNLAVLSTAFDFKCLYFTNDV